MKHYVFSIQIITRSKCEEKLACVAVLSCVAHRYKPPFVQLFLQPLLIILKLLSINRLSPGTSPRHEVAPLCNKPLYNSMEIAALEMQRFSRFTFSSLSFTGLIAEDYATGSPTGTTAAPPF